MRLKSTLSLLMELKLSGIDTCIGCICLVDFDKIYNHL
uniref:Uncharacterized protein n=1 Tax=Rhizophora mucronata TaxID=61149 RepID=A0A2P2NSF9_RHIMU